MSRLKRHRSVLDERLKIDLDPVREDEVRCMAFPERFLKTKGREKSLGVNQIHMCNILLGGYFHLIY